MNCESQRTHIRESNNSYKFISKSYTVAMTSFTHLLECNKPKVIGTKLASTLYT